MKQQSNLCTAASVAALAVAILVGQPAFAQQAAPGAVEAQQADQANPGEALAADADARTDALNEQGNLPQEFVDDLPTEPEDTGTIVVTGTAIRGVAPVGSATVDITRDTIVQSGLRDASSLISQLPQGSGLGTTLANNGGRSASLNLRGLGDNATLLLFDGHRSVAQNRLQLTDPNTIPFGAIQRVEVVTDGASAIYGSDAVAGVVNYILRRPFDGAEVTARYTTTRYEQGAVDLTLGKTWGGGGIVVAGSFEKNSNVRRYEIPQLRADLRPYGGNDARLIGTVINAPDVNGALIANRQVYGLPDNLNGRTPTAAELRPLAGQPDLVDPYLLQDYYTARERYSLLVRAEQDLGDLGELTVTGVYNRRTNSAPGAGDGSFQNVAVAIPTTSPYYVQGLGPGAQSLVYNFRLNNPGRALNREDALDVANLFVDYRVPLFADFRLTLSGGYGYSDGCEVCQPQANTILTSSIAGPDTASLFNPYQQGEQPGADGIFGLFIQNSKHELWDFSPKIDGAVFSLPAGEVRVAVGGEYLQTQYIHHSLYTLNPTTTLTTFRYANTSRNVKSAYGELFVPIFGADNATTLLQRLDFNAAVRYDHYSDFGSTTNPKFGVTWKPFDDLLLRGSYGKSFRAPTLSDTNFNIIGSATRTFVANGLNDPNIPVTNAATGQSLILISQFRFNQLRPETARIFSAGADYTPSWFDGLRLGVTYYNVDYKDRILGLPAANTALSNAATYSLYAPFFTVAPQPATCVNGSINGNPGAPEYATYNPAYLPYLNANGSYPPTTANDCQLVGILDSSTRNLGRVKQSGLDFTVNFRRDVSFGTLSLDGSFTKILQLKRSILPDAPLVDALDVIGEQVSERGRLSAGLTTGPFSGNVSANYIGSYLNNQTPTVNGVRVANYEVPSWTTFDANISFAPDVESGALAGTRFTVSARNFTDKDPPVVITADNVATDLNVHNVFGRIVTFEISKEF